MLEQKMIDKMNNQIGKEYFSAYLYRAVASYFEEKSMGGFAHYFKKQASEEYGHAEKFVKYLEDHNARVVFSALPAPNIAFSDPEAALKMVYNHEVSITASINEIAKEAKMQDDFLTIHFLGWFLEEQLEEEKTALSLWQEYQYIGDSKAAQRSMDRGLFARQ